MGFRRELTLGHQAFQNTNPERAMQAIATVSRETGLDLTRTDGRQILPEGHIAYKADSFVEPTRRSIEASLGRQTTRMTQRLTKR